MKYIHGLHGLEAIRELKGGKCWNPHGNVKTCLILHTLIPRGSVSLYKNHFLIKTESHLTSPVFMNVTLLEVDKVYICLLIGLPIVRRDLVTSGCYCRVPGNTVTC